MGIRFYCPNGHKLNVKEFQAGRRGICPYCGAKFPIPTRSTRISSKEENAALRALAAASSPDANYAPQNHEDNLFDAIQVSQDPAASVIIPTEASSLDSGHSTAEASPQSNNIPSRQAGPDVPVDHPITAVPAETVSNASTATASTSVPQASAPARQTDAFTAAGNVVWYMRPPSGGQFGPALAPIMRRWLAEGRITHDTLVWREGWRDWQLAAAVFPQLLVTSPAAKSTESSAPSIQTAHPAFSQQSSPANTQNMQTLIVTLLILGVIFIAGLIFWIVAYGWNSATDNSAPFGPSRTVRSIPNSPPSPAPDRIAK